MKRWLSLLLALLMALSVGTVALAEELSPIGTWEGNVYTNELFDFVMELPDNWQVMTDAEIASSMGYGSLYGSREGLLRVLERRSYVRALTASKENAAGYTILFNVEDLRDRHSMSEEDYYALYRDTTEKSMLKAGFTDLEEAKGTLLVGDQEHVCVKVACRVSGQPAHVAIVLFKGDNYMGSLTISTHNEQETDEVLGYIQPVWEGFAPIEANVEPLPPAEISSVEMPPVESASVPELTNAASSETWSVIGTLNGTNWDTDFPMHEAMSGVWVSDPLQLKAGDEFKVRANGTWVRNFGITNGVMVQDGDNIVIEKDGLYMITLDLNKLTLTW